MARIDPSLPDLARFLRSFLSPKQIADFIALLHHGNDAEALLPRASIAILDPESMSPPPVVSKPVVDQPAASQGIDQLLNEMEEAYSVGKFLPLTADESRRVRDAYPGFIERCSANQGRHLVKMLREKLQNRITA